MHMIRFVTDAFYIVYYFKHTTNLCTFFSKNCSFETNPKLVNIKTTTSFI